MLPNPASQRLKKKKILEAGLRRKRRGGQSDQKKKKQWNSPFGKPTQPCSLAEKSHDFLSCRSERSGQVGNHASS